MKLIKKEISESEPVRVSVYNILKSNILSLNLKPGDQISEQEISKQLNVSRTPVREAFISLSKEELVKVLPQRGTIITKIDLEQVEEARFIRENLEKAVIELAVDRIDSDTIKVLEGNIYKQKEALMADAYACMMDYDQEFHKTIFEAVNKKRTWALIEQVSTHYRMVRLLSLLGHISWELAIKQHEALVESFIKKDKVLAAMVISGHLKNLKIDQNSIRKKYPNYFK